MIAEVHAALQRLGVATRSELQAETGLSAWQVEHCLEHLLRRGSINSAEAAADTCQVRLQNGTTAACAHCPLASVCSPTPVPDRCQIYLSQVPEQRSVSAQEAEGNL